MTTNSHRLFYWTGIVVIFSWAILLVFSGLKNGGGTCFFRAVTGYHCPNCGSSRAMAMLCEGDFLDALAMNPLFVLVAVALAGLVFYLTGVGFGVFSKFNWRIEGRTGATLAVVVAGALLLNWIYILITLRY